ncbi:hypothetical protein [Novosphingobium sp. CECT 9465]|uniref:hypothetical protein n=1 Tax=Novosphingobium sp. CECT 9465 TaxID=2829794 RepID=UPI001E51C3A8|nr:hypothetical protein [Novosphingobium sp. CECT 9465]
MQQGFCGFPWQVGSDVEEAVFGGSGHIGQPVYRHADGQEFSFGQLGEKAGRRNRGFREGKLRRGRQYRFFNPLPNFYDLDRARRGMGFDASALGPGVGIVVMIDIGDQKARSRLVHDQPQIAADPYRPEIRVLGALDPVEGLPLAGRVDLKIDDAGFHQLGLLSWQPGQRGRECIGEVKVHHLRLIVRFRRGLTAIQG